MEKNRKSGKSQERLSVIIIFGVIFLLWIFLIFYFSSKSPTESSMQSHFVYKLLKKVDNVIDFSNTTLFQRMERKLKMIWFKTEYVPTEMLIRKTAHFGLYFIFGSITTIFFYIWKSDIIVSSIIGVSLPALFAVLDEYNQLFYNRGSSLNDVVIDISGSIFGMILVIVSIGTYKVFNIFLLKKPHKQFK